MNDNLVKQAVILAGGKGLRLRPITLSVPKPMALVNKRPFLDYLMAQLRSQGIRDALFLLGYKADVVRDYLKKGDSFGVRF